MIWPFGGAGLLDFDDMLVMCRELFEQRMDILQAWQRKYRYILIDEFQDINRIQYEVIRMMALPENNLFIVGDDDQSIYRFRGARPEIMLGFERDYPGTEKILLDQNYRSTAQIIGAAGQLISYNKTRFSKDITAVRGPGHSVVAKEFADPGAEARAIAAQLRDYMRLGVPYEDIAVLYRTNIGPPPPGGGIDGVQYSLPHAGQIAESLRTLDRQGYSGLSAGCGRGHEPGKPAADHQPAHKVHQP